jgi:hypothetical protein
MFPGHCRSRGERRGALAGAPTEGKRFGDGVAGEAIGAVRAAYRSPAAKQMRHAGAHVRVHRDPPMW